MKTVGVRFPTVLHSVMCVDRIILKSVVCYTLGTAD